jgi:hypothetical protein
MRMRCSCPLLLSLLRNEDSVIVYDVEGSEIGTSRGRGEEDNKRTRQ